MLVCVYFTITCRPQVTTRTFTYTSYMQFNIYYFNLKRGMTKGKDHGIFNV